MTTLFLVCLPTLSQTSQGTIQGGVFDQSGGAIAGAMTNAQRQTSRVS
jgi:DNA-binding NarL/FixJ family response regulator